MNQFKDTGSKNGESVSIKSKLRGINIFNYLGVETFASPTIDY
jgi:hypothetical protein